MIVYHGTVEKYLPGIKKDGLKVIPKNRFHAVAVLPFGDAQMPEENGVYVTQHKGQAENIARFRAVWLSMPIGKGVDSSLSIQPLFKMSGEVATSKPVLLTLDLTPELQSTMQRDHESEKASLSFWLPAIPASAIVKAEVLDDSPR